MSYAVMTFADFDGEESTAKFPGTPLTAANFDAEIALIATLRAGVNGIQRGKELKYSVNALVSPQAAGRASDEEAQREEKCVVRYHDSVTFKPGTLTIPCVDMTLQLTGHPGAFFIDGEGNEESEWTTFVAAFEAYVSGAGGNAVVVDEIVHVGRNL